VAYYIPYAKLWDPRVLLSASDELPSGLFVVGKTPRWLTSAQLEREPQALSHWQKMEERLQHVAPLATIGYSIDLYHLR
jgi:hypothetical protein